jgi:hypothetical protein
MFQYRGNVCSITVPNDKPRSNKVGAIQNHWKGQPVILGKSFALISLLLLMAIRLAPLPARWFPNHAEDSESLNALIS